MCTRCPAFGASVQPRSAAHEEAEEEISRAAINKKTGMAAAVVFVGFALAPANADFKDAATPAAKQVGMIAMAPLNSPETPQDQVWDMTYDSVRTAAIDVETSEPKAADEPMVDYTFG